MINMSQETITPTETIDWTNLYESVFMEGKSDRRANQPILSFDAFHTMLMNDYPVYVNVSLQHSDYKDLYNVYGKGYRS